MMYLRNWFAGRSGLWIILLLAAARSSTAAPASMPQSGEQDFLIRVWETEDGLPQSSAVSLAQTPDGYLWVGTFEGLARFDGVRFETFNKSSAPGLPNNSILRLHCDRQGKLWVSTEGGLATLHHGQWWRPPASSGVPTGFVRTFSQDPLGNLWLAAGGRIYQFTNEQFVQMPLPEANRDARRIRCLFDTTGRLWLLSDRSLALREGESWRNIPQTHGSFTNRQDGMGVSRDGGVWVADQTGVVKLRGGAAAQTLEFDPGFQDAGPYNLLEDRLGNLWVGSYNRGVRVFMADGRVLKITRASGLPHDAVRVLFEDREGNVWIGTDGGGLSRLSAAPSLFTTIVMASRKTSSTRSSRTPRASSCWRPTAEACRSWT